MGKPIFYFILLISLNCFINNAQANTGKMSQNQEIITFFDDYMQHYNDYIKDADNTNALKQMATTYHKSAFQVISGVPISPLDNLNELAKGSGRFLDSLVAQGVAYIKWQKINIELLTDVTAYASNVGVRYKKDGTVFNRAAADYLLIKTQAGWKIVTLVLRSSQERNNSKLIPEVNAFLTAYLKHHNDALEDEGDDSTQMMPALMAVSEDLNLPAINVTQDGNFVLFTSKQQIAKDTQSFIFDLKKQGVTHINYDKTQIKMLTNETALASNIASINKADNSALFKFGMTYLIRKGDKGWKIITRTTHPLNNILRIN